MRSAPEVAAVASDRRGIAGATTVVLLGAGRPAQGTQPSALAGVGPQRRVLDWLLDAFSPLDAERVIFVGGYRLGEIATEYPEVDFRLNSGWEREGPLGSLLTAPVEAGSTVYVLYTDVVYERDMIARLAARDGDAVLLSDRTWRRRFAGRPLIDLARAEKLLLDGERVVRVGTDLPFSESLEFAGVVKLGPRATERLAELRRGRQAQWTRQSVPAFLQLLVDEGLQVGVEETRGRWAELNAPQDLARFVLGTKAGTLARLQPLVRRSLILDHHRFTTGEWAAAREATLDALAAQFGGTEVIVRSSTAREDSWVSSNAGAFASAVARAADDRAAMAQAVDAVVASYGAGEPTEEVLVQPRLRDVAAAGVMMTRSPKTGGPYVVIDYDDVSGSTDSVTAGTAHHAKTAYVHLSRVADHGLGPVVDRVIHAAGELRELVGHDALDVEFALLDDDRLAILQVRPIVADHAEWQASDDAVQTALAEAEHELERLRDPGPFVVGRHPCLGVMPDWNPAEILGIKPRPLALSLYQHLITDEVWAQQRAELGYRDVRQCPLLVTLAGHPYVDVRASLNSFVPAALDDDVAAAIVDHQLARLRAEPHLHDKVEFELALTCMPFDFEDEARRRLGNALTAPDLRRLGDALAAVSRAAVDRIEADRRAIATLETRADAILRTVGDPVDRTYLLLEDCRRIGTLAFAHLARDAFMAMEWLRSLVRVEVLEPGDVDAFLGSLRTVTREFTADAAEVAAGDASWHDFVDRYGHLRPGTYEITSPCYADTLDRHLTGAARDPAAPAVEGEPVYWSRRTRDAIEDHLQRIGVPIGAAAFETFLRTAIEGREYAKFAFTRNLSAALEDVARIGAALGLTREELSFLHVGDVFALRRGSVLRAGDWLRERARSGEEAYRRTLAVELPALVFEPADLWAFEQFEPVPNFVTAQTVRAPAAVVGSGSIGRIDLARRIALIPNADPGYDWLFLEDIAGLVTAYGGVNSHMAIRAAEQGLPAAIGVGQHRYDGLQAAEVLELDCAGRTIRVVV